MHKQGIQKLIERFESPERLGWQKPGDVIRLMQVKSNDVIADIGAGTGYFSLRLADAAHKVIATDINDAFLHYLKKKKAKLVADGIIKNNKIEIRKTSSGETGLEDEEVDKIITVNTYHHFENRREYLHLLMKSLKPGGTLFVIDFKEGDLPIGPPADHKISKKTIESELKAAGFRVETNESLLPYQLIIMAHK